MQLNPRQQKAAGYSGPKDHLLVLAGAGTGKTRTIIGRTIFLLREGIPARRIVLLTFTRRAAAEMTRRLELEVGDDTQSIYGFRGADFRNVHSFNERMPDSETIQLEQNYRSTQEILDLANWLLGKSALGYGRKLEALRGPGTKPVLMDFMNAFDEARWYGEEIRRRHEEGARYSDFMILVRTAYLARRIEAVFVEMQIPYRFIGGTALQNQFKWEPGIAGAVGEVRRNIRSPKKAITAGIGYLDPLLSMKYDHWPARTRDLDMLLRLSERFSRLPEFLDTCTLDPVYNKDLVTGETVDDAVTLITIHSAKGTEVPICMIPQAIPGIYPHQRSIGNDDDLEEERRVFYVALTRAQNELIITRADRSGALVLMGGSGISPDDKKEHYFLSDLPDNLIEYQLIDNREGNTFLDEPAGFE
jgi:DNA helicase-2/ATP-dependent DNA helicase PcrA